MKDMFRPDFLAGHYAGQETQDVVPLRRPRMSWVLLTIVGIAAQLAYVLFCIEYPRRISIPAAVISSSVKGTVVHIAPLKRLDPQQIDRGDAYWVSGGGGRTKRCSISSWRASQNGKGWDVTVTAGNGGPLANPGSLGWLRVSRGKQPLLTWGRRGSR